MAGLAACSEKARGKKDKDKRLKHAQMINVSSPYENGTAIPSEFFAVSVSLWGTTHPLGQMFSLEFKHQTLSYFKMLFSYPV